MPFARVLSFAAVTTLLTAQSPEPAPEAGDPLAVLAALPQQEAPARGVRVVVRDEKGEPAAGASLVFVASSEPRFADSLAAANKRFPADEPSYWAMRVASGARYAIDDRGVARVPATGGRVLAWRDGVIATKSFAVEDGRPLPRVELDLKPPLSFTAVVVDAKGKPIAGVLLGIVSAARGSAFPKVTTGAQGDVAFRLLPTRTADARVRLLAATQERVEVPLPPDGGNVQLQLPDCGSVRVTFAGELVPGTAITWNLARNNRFFEPTAKEDRAAAFGFVEAGFEGTARATVNGETIEAPVPAVTAGAETLVALARASGQRALALRVLDPAGAPMRSARVSVTWRYDQGSSGSHAVTTNEGWLDLTAPQHLSGELKLDLDVRGRSWDDAVVGRIQLVLGKEETGRVDRGEQRVAPVPVALAGVLVDAAGKPISGVTLQAPQLGYARAKSGADGRFALTIAGDKPASLDLEIASPAWFFTGPSRKRTVDTSSDARFVLQPAGRMRFLAPGLPGEFQCDFDLRLEPASGDGEAIELDRRLHGRELLLPAGHWHFVVLENGQELHRVENVHVDAGIEVHDARFMQFDWQAFAALVTIRVEDKDGKPFDACTVWHQYGGRGSGSGPTDGVIRWLVRKEGGTMRVEAHDKSYATVQLGRITGEHVVRLGAGPRLEARLAAIPRLPQGGVLVAFVTDQGAGVPFDQHGKLTLWLAEPGGHRLRFGLRLGTTTYVLDVATQAFEVPAGGHTLQLDLPAGLQAAIDNVK
ncbi:MAG TPA: hypothetical protein VF384_03840 [Planctomycetota bacterium]